MKRYRTAIVGARRGLHHAKAYEGLDRMAVVALCEMDDVRRAEGVRALGVPGYADYEEMLDKERPDIVHAVTNPAIGRTQWVEPAARYGVRALIIEKPIALRPADAQTLRDMHHRTGLKIIVNHQRRYMPFAEKLRQMQASGELGPVHFARASTQGELMDMATHLMDVALLGVEDAPLSAVWATVQGGSLYEYPTLRCPEEMMATYTFSNGSRVLFESARQAYGTVDYPGVERPPFPHRCNLDIWASNGRFWWRENGSWGYQTAGMAQPYAEPTEFVRDDPPAQRAFTEAIASWLDDDTKQHHCRLELALQGFDALMAGYRSALLGTRLTEGLELSEAEWEQLKARLTNPEKTS